MDIKAATATTRLKNCIGDKGVLEGRSGRGCGRGEEGFHIRPAARRDIVGNPRDIDRFRDAYRFQTTQEKVSLWNQSNL